MAWFRQQAIAWVNVDTVLCRHAASPGQNELTHLFLNDTKEDMRKVP